MNCSMPGLTVHHQLLEFTQTHIHEVGDAIQQCRRPRFNSWVGKILWRRDRLSTPLFLDFPCGSAGKESACNAGDPGLIPGSGSSPGEGIAYPLQYSWASLVAQTKESACNAGDLGLIPGLGRSPGGRHVNLSQNSCLENPHGQKSLVGYSPWGHRVRHD